MAMAPDVGYATRTTPVHDRAHLADVPAFDLFKEGWFLGLEGALGLLRFDRLALWRKTALFLLVVWAPLVLTAGTQTFLQGQTRSALFFKDSSVYARFLICLPILFYAQNKISHRLRWVVEHFVRAELVTEDEREQFIGNVNSAMRLRYSPVSDWLIFAAACAYSAATLFVALRGPSPSWQSLGPAGHRTLSLAGWWLIVVSQPIYAFVVLRLVYRMGLWWRFLWQTAQLHLQLDAAHPDLAGGLGFLGQTLHFFKEAAFALSASVAGGLAQIVLTSNAAVSSFKVEIFATVVILVALFAGPLTFFYRQLRKVRLHGALEYGELWQRQRRQFDKKWMRSVPQQADLLSVPDFSEATDLSQILERVHQIKLVPCRRMQILDLAIYILTPFAIVITLQYPIEQIMKELLKMVL